MPGYKGHLIGGAVTFGFGLFLLQSFFQPSYVTIAEWLVCALAGSLFPDVDTKSKGQGLFYRLMLCLLIGTLINQQMQLFIALSIISIVPLLVRHRGLFHKMWFVVLFPLIVASLLSAKLPLYSTALFIDIAFFIAGAISHLILDLGVRRSFRW